VQRIIAEPEGTALRSLLGWVADLDESLPDPAWLERYVQRELPEGWLDEFVPEGAGVTPDERSRLQKEAEAGFQRETRRRERRGMIGIEEGFDDALTGRLGLRLVERDVTAREQVLWSNLRVEAGVDVRISIDLELQRLAEQLVQRTREASRVSHRDPVDQDKVEAAMAVIDARSGDILALAGAPVTGNAPRQVPGVAWRGIGYLGSVVKPFVMIEQLEAEALGRPCVPLGSLKPCEDWYRVGSTRLRCGHAHWAEGRDPVMALARSCNSFFFQCAAGLGDDGVARAMRRFGLWPAGPDDAFAACWQPRIAGLNWYAPQVEGRKHLVERRAIGYGVSASPLAVARAYAALATGRLPTLGLRCDERRPGVPLDGVEAGIEVARQGLDACVQVGTAHKIAELGAFHVMGKTGTAEVGDVGHQNNAWFAGFLPWSGTDGVQLCFCSVIYWAPDGEHGGGAAAQLVADLLTAVNNNPELKTRYITPEGGR
jgi:penicillin-binding protein 2